MKVKKVDEKYKQFIREQGCIVTGNPDCVAHHIRMGQCAGMGTKPSDYHCVPLNQFEHVKLHNMGERVYWESKKIDPYLQCIKYLVSYSITNQIDLRFLVNSIGETIAERLA